MTTVADIDPARLRAAMVDKLVAEKKVTSEAVAAALRVVPRERFMPDGLDLETAYDWDTSPVTKRNDRGEALSSVSAPWLQAVMIEQARIGPGSRVLEIGSGGYNAALLAEIVGRRGRVVSVDIDGEITDRASRRLDETGYGRVRVVQADGNRPIPGETHFDAILVTVGAWDIAPAWVEQLAPGGILVVPLIMGGVTRGIAFRRDGDRLSSLSAEVCGFVPMQGDGEHTATQIAVHDGPSGATVLRFDGPVPAGTDLAAGPLGGAPCEVWSGATIGHMISWADLYLWFACYLPGWCRITAVDDSHLRTAGESFFPYGNAVGDSLGVFVIRRLDDGSGGAELGARGFGPHGETAARQMVAQIQRWNHTAGPQVTPTFTYHLGHERALPPEPATAVLDKRHGTLLVHWPAE